MLFLLSPFYTVLDLSPGNGAAHSESAFALSLPNQNNPPEAFPGAHLPRDSGFSQVDN